MKMSEQIEYDPSYKPWDFCSVWKRMRDSVDGEFGKTRTHVTHLAMLSADNNDYMVVPADVAKEIEEYIHLWAEVQTIEALKDAGLRPV